MEWPREIKREGSIWQYGVMGSWEDRLGVMGRQAGFEVPKATGEPGRQVEFEIPNPTGE